MSSLLPALACLLHGLACCAELLLFTPTRGVSHVAVGDPW